MQWNSILNGEDQTTVWNIDVYFLQRWNEIATELKSMVE